MRHIRQANEADLDKVRKVISSAVRQCVADTDEHYEFIYAEVCCELDWWLANKDKSVLLVCEDGDSILGVALVKEYWNFSALFVEPQQHRKGVGRELVVSVINSCEQRSPERKLRLNSSNYAVPFYRKLGCTQTGEALDKPGGCVPFEYKY